jgi:hypothetical protein
MEKRGPAMPFLAPAMTRDLSPASYRAEAARARRLAAAQKSRGTARLLEYLAREYEALADQGESRFDAGQTIVCQQRASVRASRSTRNIRTGRRSRRPC